jgi:hypothetical protein
MDAGLFTCSDTAYTPQTFPRPFPGFPAQSPARLWAEKEPQRSERAFGLCPEANDAQLAATRSNRAVRKIPHSQIERGIVSGAEFAPTTFPEGPPKARYGFGRKRSRSVVSALSGFTRKQALRSLRRCTAQGRKPQKGGSEQIGVKSARLQALSRCERAFCGKEEQRSAYEESPTASAIGDFEWSTVCSDVEAPPRLELGIEVLQTSALPLGYGAGIGAVDEIRTRDIHLGKVALYH